LDWEEEYEKIYYLYGREAVDHIWKDDEELEHDVDMKNFYHGLNSILPNGVPKRYGQLATKEQVAHFIADSIHVVTVRHEVYGTKTTLYTQDNRFSGLSQVPLDNLTQSKESFLSLIQIGAATAMKPFPKLIPDPAITKKEYAITVEHYQTMCQDIQDNNLRQGLVGAFKKLQDTLIALDKEWKTKAPWPIEQSVCLPSDLEIGAGY